MSYQSNNLVLTRDTFHISFVTNQSHLIIFDVAHKHNPDDKMTNFLRANLTQFDFIGYEEVECLVIDDVLTPEECQEWIDELEAKNAFEPALITSNGEQVRDDSKRKCQRYILKDDQAKIDLLTTRLKPYLDKLHGDNITLNPWLRILKYFPGDYFLPHYDQRCRAVEGKISDWTLQVYLNDDFKGGETTFYVGDDGEKKIPYVPKRGSAIIFDQQLEHAGKKVEEGIKYCLRTDILRDRRDAYY
jgi:prolyl 4-hydroxylase